MNFPSPRIPELGQRDRCVKRAVKEGRVFTLADEQSACVASQRTSGRTVQLFWSCPKEAKRWAKALTGDDGLQEIPLLDFAADILPGLKSGKGLAGTDWVSDPVEPEIEPALPEPGLPLDAVLPPLGPEDAGEEEDVIELGRNVTRHAGLRSGVVIQAFPIWRFPEGQAPG